MRRWLAVLGVFLLGSSVGMAQRPAPTKKPVTPRSEANTPRTLDAVLPEIDWNPAQRGPLLAVVPKGVVQPRQSEQEFQGWEWETKPLQLPAKGPNGYRLTTLGEAFNYRTQTVGTLTVLAPAQMTVLNTHLPKPNIYAQLSVMEISRYLQSTLTPKQWRKLASAEGLGLADLTVSQKEAFNALLPNPMRLVRSTRTDDPKNPLSNEGMTLTPAQRDSVRLNLSRKFGWFYRMGERATYTTDISNDSPSAPRVSLRTSGVAPQKRAAMLFGAAIREEVPSRAKAGHLPFDWTGLDATVSLENAGTVGELIQRIRTATRIEIYADRRYSGYPVFVRGTSARSGDVLRALALAVTGTYRKVGPAYVLTDDIVGLGSRHAQLAAWQRSAVVQAEALRVEMDKAMKKVAMADYVGWAADDPLAPPDAIKARIDAWRIELLEKKFPPETIQNIEKQNLFVRVSEMSPLAQTIIQEQIDQYQKSGGAFLQPGATKPEMHTDKVGIRVQYSMRYLIPGVGTVEAYPGMNGGMNEFFPPLQMDLVSASELPAGPLALPRNKHVRILTITPRSAEEAEKLVSAAKRCGFTSLWVQAGREEAALIEATVKAGKSAGIPVGALVRVLRAGEKTTLPTDINILGETSVAFAKRRLADPRRIPEALEWPTQDRNQRFEFQNALNQGDWLRPDSPLVIASVLKHLKAIAEIPGLSALALSDLSGPGYRCEYDARTDKDKEEGWQLGYSEEMRLAFLREKGVDPIDLSLFRDGRLPGYVFPGKHIEDIQLPFFPDYGPTGRYMNGRHITYGVDTYDMGAKDATEKWLEFRLEAKRQLVHTLVEQLRMSAPKLPLYGRIGDEDLLTFYPTGYALLSTPEQAVACLANLPPSNASTGKIEVVAEVIRNTNQGLQFAGYIPYPGVEIKTEFARQARRMFSPENEGWNGYVLDLSLVSTADTLTLLDALQGTRTAQP